MALEVGNMLAPSAVPQLKYHVVGCTGESRAIGRKCYRSDPARVALEGGNEGTRPAIP